MSSGGNQVDVEKIRRHLAIAERRMGRRLFNGPTADNPSGKRRRVVRELDDALKQELLDWVDGGDEEGRIAMQIGRAHVGTPVTNAHSGSRHMLEQKKNENIYSCQRT